MQFKQVGESELRYMHSFQDYDDLTHFLFEGRPGYFEEDIEAYAEVQQWIYSHWDRDSVHFSVAKQYGPSEVVIQLQDGKWVEIGGSRPYETLSVELTFKDEADAALFKLTYNVK